jgi:hypothetical protein
VVPDLVKTNLFALQWLVSAIECLPVVSGLCLCAETTNTAYEMTPYLFRFCAHRLENIIIKWGESDEVCNAGCYRQVANAASAAVGGGAKGTSGA